MAAGSSLADSQAAFSDAVQAPERAVPADVSGQPPKRFNVYRNNVRTSLIGALGAQFPVSKRLVGDAFFDAMANVFVAANPPRSKILIDYGDTFPDFVAGFEPARPVPYLGDVAALEWAHGRSYHAADARALQAEDFAGVPADAWAAARLVLHPAVRWVGSDWPVLSIWHTNTHDAEVRQVALDHGEDVLLTRPQLDVSLRTIPPGGLAFVSALADKATIGAAASAALAANDQFDLAANLSGLIQSGAIAAIDVDTT